MDENRIDIQNFLPHRIPMLMVDYITQLTSESVDTVFEIKENNIFLNQNEFAEVGLIEHAAQTCSSIVGQTFFLDSNNNVKDDVQVIGFISGIKNARIYSLAKIGEIITTNANLISRFDTDNYAICTMKCNSYIKDKHIFEAEINLIIQEQN